MKNIKFLTVIALSIVTAATAAFASPPNLEVMPWQGNQSPQVESPYQYTTRVRNIGSQTAQGVVLTVDFPLTNTSPTKYILGKLTSVTPSSGTCSTANNKITCNFGSLGNNQIKSVTFTFEFQVATTAPTIKSTAAATGSSNEQNPANNTLSVTPTLAYPDHIMGTGTYLVSSCTGRGLTSFYECEIAPSSIQSRLSLDFDMSGTLAVTNYPSYMGFWDQNTLPNKSLHFNIPGELDFNGFAISGTCFEGITTFPSTTVYNSAYKVCKQ